MRPGIDTESWTQPQLCPMAPDGGGHQWVPQQRGLSAQGRGGAAFGPVGMHVCVFCKATTRGGTVLPASW